MVGTIIGVLVGMAAAAGLVYLAFQFAYSCYVKEQPLPKSRKYDEQIKLIREELAAKAAELSAANRQIIETLKQKPAHVGKRIADAGENEDRERSARDAVAAITKEQRWYE